MELTELRELVAWWISMRVTPGGSLFLVRDVSPHAPPIPMPGAYDPRSDRDLREFLSAAYAEVEPWVGSRSNPKVRACIRALLDINACQAAWPTPTRILEWEAGFVKLVEQDLEKGSSPIRLMRTVMEKYPLTPVQARDVINPCLHELIDNQDNRWDSGRREALLELSYSGDIRDSIDGQDRRLGVAARTNLARAQGLISNKSENRDQKDLLESLIDGIAKVGKANPVAIPPSPPKTIVVESNEN